MKKTILSILVVVVLVLVYQYNQLFTQTSKDTAESGIVFKKTLMLDEYKLIAVGNGLLGKYHRYSRSDRHNEVMTVYCKQFCKSK